VKKIQKYCIGNNRTARRKILHGKKLGLHGDGRQWNSGEFKILVAAIYYYEGILIHTKHFNHSIAMA